MSTSTTNKLELDIDWKIEHQNLTKLLSIWKGGIPLQYWWEQAQNREYKW